MRGLVSLTSPYSSEFLFSAGVGLPPGFCYVCVCVGLAHLVFYGRQNKCVKCRNKTILARKLPKPEDGRYRPKHVVFPLLINTII